MHLNPPRQRMMHLGAQETITQRTFVMDEVTRRRLYLGKRALVESTNRNTSSAVPPKLMKPLRNVTSTRAHYKVESSPLGWSQEAWEQKQCKNQMQKRAASQDKRNGTAVDQTVHHDNKSSSKAPSEQAKTAIVAGVCNFSPILLETDCASQNNTRRVKKIRRKGTCTTQFARWRRNSKRQASHGQNAQKISPNGHLSKTIVPTGNHQVQEKFSGKKRQATLIHSVTSRPRIRIKVPKKKRSSTTTIPLENNSKFSNAVVVPDDGRFSHATDIEPLVA